MGEFIESDKQLDKIIKGLKLNISMEDHDYLVCELYHHIDQTRLKSYMNGYEQGRFDVEADSINE